MITRFAARKTERRPPKKSVPIVIQNTVMGNGGKKEKYD